MSKSSKANKGKTFIIIGIAMGMMIIILLAVVIGLLMKQPQPTALSDTGSASEKRNTVINSENVEQVLEEIEEERTAPGSYEVKMNTTWCFKDGASPSVNAYVENVANNTNDIYFDVVLADTQEVILESPLIPLGSYMDDITLDKDLDAGTYNCVLIYHLVDEEQVTLSTLRMALKIVIEN